MKLTQYTRLDQPTTTLKAVKAGYNHGETASEEIPKTRMKVRGAETMEQGQK